MPLTFNARTRRILARDFAVVMGFNVVLAVVITVYGPAGFGLNLAYSLAIGTAIWLVVDLGRFALHPLGHLQGWRLLLLVLAATVLGYAAGNALVDVLRGLPPLHTWRMSRKGPSGFFVMSLAAGAALVYYFMSREQLATTRLEKEQAEKLAAQARGQATEAQLTLLQSQLEPHMLFNTLANLRALIQTDPPRATAMLDRLNDYLRATLAASRTLTPTLTHSLGAEFERLRDYLELMRVRMGERLAYELDLPQSLRSAAVPPLLLQPLVENAIKHGLEPKVAGGRLVVRAQQSGQRLVLHVQDDGIGLPQGHNAPPHGFGLTQVRERLRTRYGADATFSIANNVHFTAASIEFPLENAPAEGILPL
jgi:signal transduction histidine kinase